MMGHNKKIFIKPISNRTVANMTLAFKSVIEISILFGDGNRPYTQVAKSINLKLKVVNDVSGHVASDETHTNNTKYF